MIRRTLPLLLLVLLLPAKAHAAWDQEAMFQDDDALIYTTDAKRQAHLDELQKLGVDRIRITVLWRAIAPARRPKGFDATDPASYGPVWGNYDALIFEAAQRGIGVNLDLTGPSPNWANKKAPRSDIQDTYEPSPKAFGQFVTAVARRYPGVTFWSIWNEPNHSGWLTPTWQRQGHGPWYERSASLYRSLLDSAYKALVATGHGRDTILFGETAPAGSDTSRDIKRFMTPLRFVRALYCVNQRDGRLHGAAAKRLGCPKSAKAFRRAHPALFKATGYAHHPYQLLFAPDKRPTDPNYVTIGVMKRLESNLDRIQRRYGSRKRFPIYITEFGYQSQPDPLGVSQAKQATYINQSEYLAARDPRIKSFSQFLLRDGGNPISLTFQSGLRLAKGNRKKPAYAAYRLPVWVTGHKVWGVARPATGNDYSLVAIQFKAKGAKRFKTIKRVPTRGRHNWFRTKAKFGHGTLRLAYGTAHSRDVKV